MFVDEREMDDWRLTSLGGSAVMKCFHYHCQGSSKKEYILSFEANQLLKDLHIKLPKGRFGTVLTRFWLAVEFLSSYENLAPQDRFRRRKCPYWFQRAHLMKILDSKAIIFGGRHQNNVYQTFGTCERPEFPVGFHFHSVKFHMCGS
jgi:hypothetical protein